MQQLIPVLNKLQGVFARVGSDSIKLPQIVVVGSQSCGKSSVLESLVQKDFLPRGSGIVTRRPLILQLIHNEDRKPAEFAQFQHTGDKIFTDFNEVRREIEAETERECGPRDISNNPIILTVYSPTVMNLTLVDLPGLTKVATTGQRQDLPKLIRDMVYSFIKPEISIILAISPANSDIANSDSLLIAREVDPEGRRTIGVITKLDLMDKGTNARDALMNKVYPLQLGYIGVVNRSQMDIDNSKPVDRAVEDERRFFLTTPEYRDLADQCGYKFLAYTLNRILLSHIKAKLPLVHTEINELLRRKQHELEGYGAAFGDNPLEQQMFLYHMLEHYLEEFGSLLNGTSDELRMNGIDGGQYLMEYLVKDLPAALNKIEPASKMDKKTVTKMIEANSGVQRTLFFPEKSFHMLVQSKVEEMRAPCVQAAEVVHHRLMELHTKTILPELDRFPNVKRLLSQSIVDIARESLEECVEFVNNFIDTETAYVNAEDPKLKERTAETAKSGSLKENSDLLLDLVDRYIEVCKREISDVVPKTIHRILIRKSTDVLRVELFKRLVTNPDLAEDPDIVARRKKCQALIGALHEAASILNEVRMSQVSET